VSDLPQADLRAELLVLGSGPGGYTAAFRAADLGKQVVLVERHATLGGVCLNVGCIPSKALLHLARVITEAREVAAFGVELGEPRLDLEKIRAFESGVVGQLTKGLANLAKRRKVQVVQGAGSFEGPNLLRVEGAGEISTVAFEQAVVAVGSRPVALPGLPDDPRVMDSTAALRLEEIPGRLLVIGGGIIGLELASVYHALGSAVTVVELLDQLMTGADPDLVKPLHQIARQRYQGVFLGTKRRRSRRGTTGSTSPWRARTRPPPSASTGCWWRWGAAPTVTASGRSGPACSSTRPASSRWMPSCAARSPTSSPSVMRWVRPCWPTRPPTRGRPPPR
jgi:dihydrolipoamide dehydrogenase